MEGALDGELDAHLESQKESGKSNRRHGRTQKQLRSQVGSISIEPPRDREGDFDPILVKKWERNLGSGLENQVLELYSLGNSYEDIQSHLLEMYGVSLSKGQLSAITDRVWSRVQAGARYKRVPFLRFIGECSWVRERQKTVVELERHALQTRASSSVGGSMMYTHFVTLKGACLKNRPLAKHRHLGTANKGTRYKRAPVWFP